MLKFLFVTALVFLALLLEGCGKPVVKAVSPQRREAPDAVPVTVASVQTVPMDRTLKIVGTLYGKDEATIGAEVEGRVEKTLVDFGDRLKAGELIAQIDTASYRAVANQGAANVAKAAANAANADQNLTRIRQLHDNHIASPSDLDKAVADADQAHAAVKAVEAEHEIAKLNLEKSQVRAPWDGAVADRIATAGDYLKIGAPLFRVVNDSVLKYIVQARESYAGLIQKEQLVQFEVDAYPGEKFEGRVFLISPQVNTIIRAFPFGALVQNQEHRLKANTFARGEVILERNVSTLVVPLDAIVTFSGISRVFVVENGIAHSRQVQTGRVRGGQQEVLTGLKKGELVVLTGQTRLFEGSKVRIKDSSNERLKQPPESARGTSQAHEKS